MLYLVDTDLGQIILCTTIGSNCVVLVDNLVRPHDVTIDFKSRELIWSEWGTGTDTGSICKCLMDGSGRTVIIGSVRHPTSLELDATMNSLYWTAEKDAGHVVQMIKLGTQQERKDIHQTNNIRSGSQTLSILGDSLYLVDGNRIVVVDKVTGHGEPTPVETDLSPGAIVAVYHPVEYQTGDVTDWCDASPCSHVCVPSNSLQGYKCLCPTDMELVSNDKCHTKNVTRIVTSGAKGIYEVPLQYVGSSVARARLVLDVDAHCLAYDSVNQVIVFHDELEKSIKTLDVKNGGLCRTVYKHIRYIEDLAIDTTAHNLYWTTRQGQVIVGKLDGSLSVTLVYRLSKPRGITLDPGHGYMYICDWGTSPQILRCHMDGTHCAMFISVPGGHPNMVVIESHDLRRTLYWTDSKLDVIGHVFLDDENRTRNEMPLSNGWNPHSFGIVMTDSTIYYTDLNTHHIFCVERADSTIHNMSLGLGSLYGLDMIVPAQAIEITNGCSHRNGGCAALCLAKPQGQRLCVCPPGSESTDNTTCTGTPQLEVNRLGTNLKTNVSSSPLGIKLETMVISPPLGTKPKPKFTSQPPGTNPKPKATSPPLGTKLKPKVTSPSLGAKLKPKVTSPSLGTKLKTKVTSLAATFSSVTPHPGNHNNTLQTVGNHGKTKTSSVNIWLIVGLVVGCGLVLVIILGVYYWKTRVQRNWMVGLIKYIKDPNPTEESEELVPSDTPSNNSFQNFDDLDYPGSEENNLRLHSSCYGNSDRETSMISMDSAFTEIRDCSTYSVDLV